MTGYLGSSGYEARPIKSSEIAQAAAKKIIEGDWIWHPDRGSVDAKTFWHNYKGQSRSIIAFGDGHAGAVKFPTTPLPIGATWILSGWPALIQTSSGGDSNCDSSPFRFGLFRGAECSACPPQSEKLRAFIGLPFDRQKGGQRPRRNGLKPVVSPLERARTRMNSGVQENFGGNSRAAIMQLAPKGGRGSARLCEQDWIPGSKTKKAEAESSASAY